MGSTINKPYALQAARYFYLLSQPNCAVLGVAYLTSTETNITLLNLLFYGLAAAVGFSWP